MEQIAVGDTRKPLVEEPQPIPMAVRQRTDAITFTTLSWVYQRQRVHTMKNPPTPDTKPHKWRQPANHSPKRDPFLMEPAEDGTLDPMDDVFLHGEKITDKYEQH